VLADEGVGAPFSDQLSREMLTMSKMVQTILITREHVFAATVVAKGRRLLDLLNDSLTGYV